MSVNFCHFYITKWQQRKPHPHQLLLHSSLIRGHSDLRKLLHLIVLWRLWWRESEMERPVKSPVRRERSGGDWHEGLKRPTSNPVSSNYLHDKKRNEHSTETIFMTEDKCWCAVGSPQHPRESIERHFTLQATSVWRVYLLGSSESFYIWGETCLLDQLDVW